LAVDTADVYVLLSNGTIVGWGDNRYGQFGNGEAESAIGGSNTPVAIAKSVNGVKALASSDDGAVLALLNNGEIDSWGNAD
jgi:alpha-tubulin suppressor-like RCC1 family protein